VSDWHLRVLRAAARRARLRLAEDRARKEGHRADAAEPAGELERRSKRADRQLADAETRRGDGPRARA
jgi:hypothetical protein